MNPKIMWLWLFIVTFNCIAGQPIPYAWSSGVILPSRSFVSSDSAELLLNGPQRTRSLPHSPLVAGVESNKFHSTGVGAKSGVSLSEVGMDVILGLLVDRPSWVAVTPKTTVETTTTQSATVDIESLPGYWLKDPSRIQEPTGVPYGVDYRTERYRLEDLLKKKSP